MLKAESYFIETPIGAIVLRYQAAPFKLLAADLTGRQTPAAPQGEAEPGIEQLPKIFGLVQQYFAGRPISPPWDLLSLDYLTPLQQKVLYETAQIPYGSLKTYQWIAGVIGRPRAYRFVGTALGKNPFPIIIPCHRVIRSDGRIGNFSAGPDIKQWLIDFEAGSLPA